MIRSKSRKSPRKVLIKKLDVVFSKVIRLRDSVNGENTCITCYKILPINKLDAGHFMTRDSMATRYDERNVQPQCISCNRFHGGRQAEFGIELDKKYGEGTARGLIDKSHTIKKYYAEELSELLSYYKERLKLLEE